PRGALTDLRRRRFARVLRARPRRRCARIPRRRPRRRCIACRRERFRTGMRGDTPEVYPKTGEDAGGVHAAGDQLASGRSTLNDVPSPRTVRTATRPPRLSLKRFTRYSPQPVLEALVTPLRPGRNSSKRCGTSSGEIPGPVSVTESRTPASTRSAVTDTV